MSSTESSLASPPNATKKILVIGATGNQGRGVVRDCLAAGHAPSALVRDLASASAQALRKDYPDLPFLQGSTDDADALKKAAAGMDAVFFIIPPAGIEAERIKTQNVIDAARASGTVSTLIYSGAVLTGQHESFPGWGPDHPMYQYWVAKHNNETMVREAGFKHWAIVRPTFFLTNFLPPFATFYFPELFSDAPALRVAWRPDLKIDYIDPSDVGKAVAAVLTKPEMHAGQAHTLASDTLTGAEFVERYHAATGVQLKLEHISVDTMMAEKDSRLVVAQALFNDVPTGLDAKEPREKFGLTTVESFFKQHPR